MLLDWAYAAGGAPWIDLAQLAADVVATISTWRRARSAASRPLVTRLIADFRDPTSAVPKPITDPQH